MPSLSEPRSAPTVVGVPVLSDDINEDRNENSASADNSTVAVPVLDGHSEHTAVTRLVPLLKRLAVGAKIPTHFQTVPLQDEGARAITPRIEETPIIILPPSLHPPMQVRPPASLLRPPPKPREPRQVESFRRDREVEARTGTVGDGHGDQADPPKRSRILKRAAAGLAFLGALAAAGLLVKAQISRKPNIAARIESPAAPSSTAIVTAGAVAKESAAEAPVVEAPVVERAPVAGACRIVGKPKVVATQAVLASGLEVAPSPRGIALGFASRPLQAVGMFVDPATLAVTGVRATRSSDPIRRVTPVPMAMATGASPLKGQRPKIAVSTDRSNDAIALRRTSSGASPIDIGIANGHLVWAPHDTDEVTSLWPLAGNGPVEAMHAVPLEAPRGGYAIAFKRAGSIFMGVVSAKGNHRLSMLGNLSETKGLGAQVGFPSIAVSGDTVFVAWADRANAKDPWSLRYRQWQVPQNGEAIVESPANAFEVPSGGLGAPYMAPAVSSLGGGRFLLLWTEGPSTAHRVRGQTIDAHGRPLGEPLVITDETENAGQAQAAVLPDGRGVAAYLAATPHGFKVMATAMDCH